MSQPTRAISMALILCGLATTAFATCRYAAVAPPPEALALGQARWDAGLVQRDDGTPGVVYVPAGLIYQECGYAAPRARDGGAFTSLYACTMDWHTHQHPTASTTVWRIVMIRPADMEGWCSDSAFPHELGRVGGWYATFAQP